MMRWWLTILLFFVYSAAFASKKDTADLRKSVYRLNEALMMKDTAVLKKLLHKKCSYGHSNGWVETKRDVIGDLYNGKLVYQQIDQDTLTMTREKNLATVRSRVAAKVLYEGKEVSLKLHVMQVWMKEKKGWLLLSRQSTKID